MKSIISRLEKLEAALNQPGTPVFLVYLEDSDGILTRWDNAGEVVETMTRAEFEALPGQKIRIRPQESEEEE